MKASLMLAYKVLKSLKNKKNAFCGFGLQQSPNFNAVKEANVHSETNEQIIC